MAIEGDAVFQLDQLQEHKMSVVDRDSGDQCLSQFEAGRHSPRICVSKRGLAIGLPWAAVNSESGNCEWSSVTCRDVH